MLKTRPKYIHNLFNGERAFGLKRLNKKNITETDAKRKKILKLSLKRKKTEKSAKITEKKNPKLVFFGSCEIIKYLNTFFYAKKIITFIIVNVSNISLWRE